MRRQLCDDYLSMYSYKIYDLGVGIPFIVFDVNVLKVVNVTHLQLHQNSWTFLKGFEICCASLGNTQTIGTLSHFIAPKGLTKKVGFP